MTCEEWWFELCAIICATYDRWPDKSTFKDVIFMYDNPSFHNLTDEEKEDLVACTPLDNIGQLQHPPRYSGDFMQCIEHVHSIICNEWWSTRLKYKSAKQWEAREGELQSIFMKTVTAQTVTDNLTKLLHLCEYVAAVGTGDYAPLELT